MCFGSLSSELPESRVTPGSLFKKTAFKFDVVTSGNTGPDRAAWMNWDRWMSGAVDDLKGDLLWNIA